MNSYNKEIISYLRDDYGLNSTEIRLFGGGNHPRLEFQYQEKPYTLTLQRNSGGASTINLKKQDIRRILGQPPKKEIKQPRKLENMMPEPVPFNPALQIESLTKPPEVKQQTITEIGYVAIYISNNKGMMRFYIPKNILGKSGLIGKSYLIKPIGKYNWDICQSSLNQKNVCSSIGQISTINQQNFLGMPPKMGRSPARFFLVGSNIRVQLEGRDIKAFDETHSEEMKKARNKVHEEYNKRTLPEKKESNAQAALLLVTDTPVVIPKTPTIDDLTKQLKFVLDTIRNVERTTPYRLMRNKETGNWLFSAPRIE